MVRLFLTACVLCACVFGGSFVYAVEADGSIASPEKGWPQWRGPKRDGISEETGLLKTWPAEGPALIRKITGIGRGWSSPIIVGDALYITGDNAGETRIFCFDLKGVKKWDVSNGGAWTANYQGSRATCTYSEGALYHLSAHGRLAALDAASGKELWNIASILRQFESKNINWGLSECLLADGPRLIVTPGGPKAMMVALDKKNGSVLWSTEAIQGDNAAYAPPMLYQIGARRIIAGNSSHNGFGVDAETGKLLWKVPVRNNWGATCCAPAYAGGSVFYAAPDGAPGTQYKINLDADPVATEVSWRSPADPLTGSAILKDGLLYTNGCKKSRALHAIDWKTGESRYELALSMPTNNHATCALMWADQRLYGLFENGIMALLNPTADKFEIAGKFKLADAPKSDAWAHPVLLNGVMYLRYHDTLWCYDVKEK